jgi:poly-gamma-glutamate capsule biosynthesis protein CapA/YwtB (metallophosphatase superfamily)
MGKPRDFLFFWCQGARSVLAAFLLLSACIPVAGQESSPPARDYNLVFVGDIMLSRGVGRRMVAENDFAYPFQLIRETLAEADLTFANLECPVSDQGKEKGHLYSFRADPKSLEGLLTAGIDVVSVANNHMYDWGPDALLDTVSRLRAAGIRPVGAGSNDLEAHYPQLIQVGDLRLAFLTYVEIPPEYATAAPGKPGVAWLEPERVLADIRFARPLADIVIVSPHWGVEYARKPTPKHVELAHRIIDAGADLLVGTHPHVIQPVEEYNGHWIAYSLGNFIFDQKAPGTNRGLMLKVRVVNKKVAEVVQVPISISTESQASLAPPAEPIPVQARSGTGDRPESGGSMKSQFRNEAAPKP